MSRSNSRTAFDADAYSAALRSRHSLVRRDRRRASPRGSSRQWSNRPPVGPPARPRSRPTRDRRATPTTRSTRGSMKTRRRSAGRKRFAGATSPTCRRPSCSFTSTGMHGATLSPPGCVSAGWPGSSQPPPADAWSSMDVTVASPARSIRPDARPDEGHALHRSRRWERAGPDGDVRSARTERRAQ